MESAESASAPVSGNDMPILATFCWADAAAWQDHEQAHRQQHGQRSNESTSHHLQTST